MLAQSTLVTLTHSKDYLSESIFSAVVVVVGYWLGNQLLMNNKKNLEFNNLSLNQDIFGGIMEEGTAAFQTSHHSLDKLFLQRFSLCMLI